MSTATNRPINRKVVLAAHPDGMVKESDFRIEEEQLGELGEGEVLVKQEAISIDAFIRTALNEQDGLHTAVPIGGVIGTLGVGRVVESNSPDFAVGDAAFILDPTSSHGVLRAIMSGIYAANLIIQSTRGHVPEGALPTIYHDWMRTWLQTDMEKLKSFYGKLSLRDGLLSIER